ncbi:MAG TPA: SxtJ family membrane protein [Prosthecobacter sp.]
MIAIDWKPEPTALRKFGKSMLIFGLVFAAWFGFRGSSTLAWVCAGAGVVCFVTSYFVPAVARYIYVFWMALAWLLSQIITPIIMGAMYYLVVTPIGLVLRMSGHDRLRLKKPAVASYWTDVPATSKAGYDRQF